LLHSGAADPQFIRDFLVTVASCHGIEDHFSVGGHLSFAELLLEDADEAFLVRRSRSRIALGLVRLGVSGYNRPG